MPPAHSTIPTLTDGVATLRAPTDDDIEGSYEQCQDPESQQWTLIPVPYSRDDARTYLRHIIPGGWESNREWGFVVEARDDAGVPRFAGTISLRNMDEGRAEIAYGVAPLGPRPRRDGAGAAAAPGLGVRRAGPAHGAVAGPARATGPRAGWPGGSASASRARCATGCRSAGCWSTPGWARFGAASRCHRESGGCWLRGSSVTPWC